jgi:hypothetical protein
LTFCSHSQRFSERIGFLCCVVTLPTTSALRELNPTTPKTHQPPSFNQTTMQQPATEALRTLLACTGAQDSETSSFSFDSIFQATLSLDMKQDSFPHLEWSLDDEDASMNNAWESLSDGSEKKKKLCSSPQGTRMVRSCEISSNLSMLACAQLAA